MLVLNMSIFNAADGWDRVSNPVPRHERLVLTGEMKTEIVIAGGGDVEAMSGMPVEHAENRNIVFPKQRGAVA